MADSQQSQARPQIRFDAQRALLRINRFHSAVDALIKATEAQPCADSAEAYSKAYAAFLDGCRTIEAMAYDLEDVGFAGTIAPNPAEMERSQYRYGKPNTIFEDGKLVGGFAVLLVDWLQKLKDEIEKARDFCSNLQEPPTEAIAYLTDEDWDILQALNEDHPKLLTQEQIEGNISNLRVSVRTIQRRLPILVEKKLVVQPEGKKSGWGLSRQGLAVAKRQD
jgi:hypothetical protein